MINILISIKKPFSDGILFGEKSIELRRSKPIVTGTVDDIILWIYESGRDGERAIIGKCRYLGYVSITKSTDNNVVEWISSQAQIEKDYLLDYAPCYGWLIQNPERFSAPVPLSSIGQARPPQSWKYLTAKQIATLKRETSE